MSLIGVPTKEAIALLKEELFEKITKFRLLDEEENAYFEDEIKKLFFDENGVLTAICEIPLEENFTKWNKYLEVIADDGVVITKIETPLIQFVKNIGGAFEVKIGVSGKSAEIIYKKDDYLTDAEFRSFYYPIFEALSAKTAQLEKLLLTLEEELKKLKGVKDATNTN